MRKGSRIQRFAAGVVSLGLALSLGLGPWPAAAQTFSESTDVTVVEVPVQVVKDGEPIRGLTVNDFEVFDGRKKVQITGFEVLDLAAAAPAATQAAVPQVPVSARRHFMMLFDLSFSEPKSIAKARQAALGVVQGLHPTDLVAVSTYSTLSGPQLVLGFTPDRGQIAAALDTLGLPKLVDRAPDPLRLVLTDARASALRIDPTGGGGTAQGAEVKAAKEAALVDTLESLTAASESAERSVQQQVLRTMTKSLTDLARLMAEVEGRKYVVYLSEGFDASLIQGRGAPAGTDAVEFERSTSDSRITDPTGGQGSDEQFGDTRSINAVEKMLEEFRRADCQIQAVDIGGLRAGADQGGQRPSGREALFNMAKSTGGELYENFNDLSVAMGQMLRRTGVTYVLSFQPDSLKPDGSFHKLRVELKNAARGSRVVYRQGYYAPRPVKEQSPLQRLLETASTVMGDEGGALAASVLAAPFASGKDLAYVPVVIEVNGASLLAGKQAATLPVEIYVYAIDANGSVQDFFTQTLGLDLTKAEPTLRQAGLKFFGHLELPKGNYSIRTLVRNGTTGASSLRVSAVAVPAFAAGEAALLPPLFPDPSNRWLNVRETPKEGQPQAAYPFMLKQQPYIPTSLPMLTPGQPAAMVLQGYNLGEGELKADLKILSADGKEIPGGSLKLAEKEGGATGPVRVAATFQPPALQPGEYTLQVTVTGASGKAETSKAQFAVAGGAAGARGSH
jgi:VWFA-related protein